MATAPTTTVKKASFWKSRNVLLGAAITALVAGGGVTYALWPSDNSAKAIALAQKGPDELRKAVESGQIKREDAWGAMNAAREMEMQKQMNAYFALKTPADRNKFLDKMIDEQQARMREWQQRATTRPARPEGERRGPATQPDEARRKEMEQRRNERADKQSPTERAQRAEFMIAMRKRMEERGIQGGPGMRGFGGGPGGGFGGGRGGDGPRGGGR